MSIDFEPGAHRSDCGCVTCIPPGNCLTAFDELARRVGYEILLDPLTGPAYLPDRSAAWDPDEGIGEEAPVTRTP